MLPDLTIPDAMVDAYLAAQRATVEEADRNFGRPNIGGMSTDTVRSACRAGLAAALRTQPAAATVPGGELPPVPSSTTVCAYGYDADDMQAYGRKCWDAARAALAAPAAPQEQPSDERLTASEQRMLHDFPHLMDFYQKHALGPMRAPSCLRCGKSMQGEKPALKHLELPGIVICADCMAPSAAPQAGEIQAQARAYVAVCETLEALDQGCMSRIPTPEQAVEVCLLIREAFTDPAPQAGEDVQPVAWRHSKTMCLYETEEEVPLADGDEWAEPLYAAPQPAPQAAPVVPLDLTDMEIERGWHATFSTSNPYCPCNLKSFTKAVRWAIRALTTQGASHKT